MASLARSPRAGVALLLLLLFAAGCGNKKPPAPPVQIIPARTFDLKIQQRGSELLLSFTYPTTTLEGLPLGALQGVEFWELVREVRPFGPPPAPAEAEEDAAPAPEGEVSEEEGEEAGETEDDTAAPEATAPERQLPERLEDLVIVDPAEFAAAATIRVTLTGPELESAILGEQVTARFPLGEPPADGTLRAHVFAVKTLSSRGLGSPFSNQVTLVRRQTPAGPTAFETVAGGDGVELRWSFAGKGPDPVEEEGGAEVEEEGGVEVEEEGGVEVEEEGGVEVEELTAETEAPGEELEFEGFHVYRRDARARSYGPPLARLSTESRTYTDRGARLGERYIYAVAAILESVPVVETALSVEREVDYEDRFPPPPPDNLVTLVQAGSVRLLWDASDADDVGGYFVLRQTGEGEFAALNSEPIQELEYTDTDVASGRVYRYRVAAVDVLGNRGPESDVSEARVP